MSAHTPGPWLIAASDMPNGHEIVTVYPGSPFPWQYIYTSDRNARPMYSEAIANARLIAAAPEMLAMLEKLWDDADLTPWLSNETLKLIQKARGE